MFPKKIRFMCYIIGLNTLFVLFMVKLWNKDSSKKNPSSIRDRDRIVSNHIYKNGDTTSEYDRQHGHSSKR